MELREHYKCDLIDCHIHFPHYQMTQSLISTADQLGIGRFNIVCTPHEERLSLVPDALYLKSFCPERVFVFGGLNVAAYFMAPDRVGELFADQIGLLLAAGCDGIKMIEGKPLMRKMLPVPPFDSQSFAPFWAKAADSQVPILIHINDPEEFWDQKKVPDWAIERGWFYGDGSFINNEDQYKEIYNVLEKNPKLKIILAHFFFMSAQQSRLADLLDTYPNLYVDLTPGIEMFQNFSMNIDQTREFFIKYQDRIIFGTDIGAKALLVDPGDGIQLKESHERVYLIRNFLENRGEYFLDPQGGYFLGDPTVPFRGIYLPEPVLEKIYFKNFEKAVGKTPRVLSPQAIIEMCAQIERMLQIQGSSQEGVPGDFTVLNAVKAHFEKHI